MGILRDSMEIYKSSDSECFVLRLDVNIYFKHGVQIMKLTLNEIKPKRKHTHLVLYGM